MALRPSERIRLIKDLARLMHDEDWGHYDLIFNEFGGRFFQEKKKVVLDMSEERLLRTNCATGYVTL
jgi:hypothetical protein